MFVRSWRALAGLLALTFLAMIGPWAAAACASPRPGPPSSPAHAYDASAYGYDSPSRLFREHRAASVREAPVPGRSLVAARPAAAAWGASNLISGFVVAAKAAPGVNGALRDAATGRFAANPATATAARSSSVHGNSLASSVPTTLYRRVTSGGDFQKWGISGNLKGRYTSTEVGTDQLIPMTSGGRSDMVNLERWLVRNDPGPMNLEPWAGR